MIGKGGRYGLRHIAISRYVLALFLLVLATRASAAVTERGVYYTYDLMGRQLTATFDSAGGTDGITNTYDGFGDLTSSTIRMGSFTKTLRSSYDGAGRRTQLVHPENSSTYTFTYSYDALGRLSGVYEGVGTTNPLDSFTYATNGLLSARSEAPGSSAGYTWDDAGRLLTQTDAFTGVAPGVGWTLAYNPASQIVQETRDNDAYAWNGARDVDRDYAVNGLNQYSATSIAGAASAMFGYDANGNLTSSDSSTNGSYSYAYDVENRLVSANDGTYATTLTYDPLGRLFQVVRKNDSGSVIDDTRFVYDGDALVLEYNSSGVVTDRYVHGSNAAADDPLVWYPGRYLTNPRWLHADHLGSIVAVTDSAGASASINSYDEYGMPQIDPDMHNQNTGRFQYTGQAWIDEIGLYYYKARLYSPVLGRFLQTDPIGYEGGVNLYGYVGADPANQIDSDGTSATDIVVTGVRAVCDAACQTFANVFKLAPGAFARVNPLLQLLSADSTACLRSEGCTDNDPLYSEKVDQWIKRVLSDGKVLENTGRHKSVYRGGGPEQMERDWKALLKTADSTAREISGGTQYGPGEQVQLPEGGTASIRPSSSKGQPTLQISNRPGFPEKVTIRY